MGKSLSDYRKDNEEALRFFDEYVSPPMPPAPVIRLKPPRSSHAKKPFHHPMIGLNTPAQGSPPKKTENAQRRALKKELLSKQFGLCAYCDDPMKLEEATFDHRLAKSKGGKLKRGNLVLVCSPCNQMKGDISSVDEANERIFKFTEFIARLAQRGYLK